MAFDVARGVSVLATSSGTYEWHGSMWVDRTSASQPPTRVNAAMVYDPVIARCVMFGGTNFSNDLSETWEWDGSAGTWTQVATTGAPGGRHSHAMVWDAGRQRTVLFGGIGPLWLGDTWEYDGAAATWSQIVQVGPPARAHHAMAYDFSRQKGVLTGGSDVSATYGDTWEWDSFAGTWSQLTIGGPGERVRATMAFDSLRGRMVLYGGLHDPAPAVRETWGLESGVWSRLADNGSPFAGQRWATTTTFDSGRGVLVCLAYRVTTTVQRVEVWEWDGNTWTRRFTPTAPIPSMFNATMRAQYDPGSGTVLMLMSVFNSGFSMATWEWDGGAGTWTQLQPAVMPSPRSLHSLGFDPVGDRILMFGGSDFQTRLSDTWAWDRNAQTWVQLAPANMPSGRYGAALATDTKRQRLILFGGQGSALQAERDTWEWDGSNWRQLQALAASPAREFPTMTYDVARDRVVRVGGAAQSSSNAIDFWEWDGSNWAVRTVPGQPQDPHHLIEHDPVRRQSVVLSRFGRVQTLLYGPESPASHEPFGAGCPSSVGIPQLNSEPWDKPWIGDTFHAWIDPVPTGSLALMVFGVSNTSWLGAPLPLSLGSLGLSGCDLWISADASVLVANLVQPGRLQWSFQVPANPGLVGAGFFQQALVLDSTAPNGLGAVTNAAALVVGSR